MGSDVRGVTTVGNGAIRVDGSVCICKSQLLALPEQVFLEITLLLLAVCFVVVLASITVEACRDLSSNSNTISDLDCRYFRANFHGIANDFWEK